MTRHDKELMRFYTIIFVVLCLIVMFFSYMEARSYRKYCRTPVTAWDALFLDLRIDECTRPKGRESNPEWRNE